MAMSYQKRKCRANVVRALADKPVRYALSIPFVK